MSKHLPNDERRHRFQTVRGIDAGPIEREVGAEAESGLAPRNQLPGPINRGGETFPRDSDSGDVTAPSEDRSTRLRQGQWAIRTLLGLGFDKREIADLAHVDRSTLSDVLESDGLRAVSVETVRKLLTALRNAGAERLRRLLPSMNITVLDTCCDKGRVLDNATRDQIADSIRTDILNALAFGSAPVRVVPGVVSFLAQIGDRMHGLYVFKAPLEGITSTEEHVGRLLVAEHELEHILQRFRMERWQLEKKLDRTKNVPREGHIA